MNTTMFGITWGALERFWYSPVLIVVLFVLLYRLQLVRRAITALAAVQWRGIILRNVSYRWHVVRLVLFFLGALFLFMTLLRPQTRKKEEIVKQEGRDLFIAVDVSRSMLAKDCMPSRLDCTKAKIKSLVSLLSCERVGLILFSGSSLIQCPLTSDHNAFFMFLDQLDVETISSGTTALDQAIKKALVAFRGNSERKNKLLVLFTDGEDFSSNLSGVKQEAIKERMHIFAMGVGTPEGAPVPLLDNEGNQAGHQLDRKGNVVISRLNESMLHNLAEDSGGKYIRVTEDENDVRTLVRIIQQFEKEKFEDKKIVMMEEQYSYFLMVSFICFALEWLL